MKKYTVGIEFKPNGETASTKGLISGAETNNIKKKIKLHQKRNTYVKAIYDKNKQLDEIWVLNKKEYDNLRCGFGLSDFGDFIKDLI